MAKKIDMLKKAEKDWMNYAGAVAKSRAIPFAEDNLKPVQRRILYAMSLSKLWPDKKTVKCAAVVGDVMKYFHPHGDASIYDALIHMSQWWKVRVPLIEVQGNNGSLNGDGPAAHRYTECKLTKAGALLLQDTDPDVVPFKDNYDGTTTEPTLLPSIFPNVLINGSLGIAVGMSCSLLPHNPKEVCDLLTAIVDGKVNTVDEAMEYLHGPDFPLGGVVIDGYKLKEAYATGKGSITQRAKYEIDSLNNTITFSEFPYLVDVESRIIKSIKEMIEDGYGDIEDVENHIGKETCNIKVILTKKANPQKVLKDLWDKTPLEKVQKIDNTVVFAGMPMTMNLLGLGKNYLKFQHQILIKKATKEKAKQDKIVHINKGLLLAIAKIDEAIAVIRQSDSKDMARKNLINLLGVDVEQADAILGMQLGRLTRLDSNDIQVKIDNAEKESAYQATIIEQEPVRNGLIKDNLAYISKEFGDARRTTIIMGSAEEKEKEKNEEIESMKVVINDGTIVDVEVRKFDSVFKKGEQLAKYEPIMWVYNDKKPVSVLHKDGTTSDMFDKVDSKQLFVWDKSKEFIVTVSKKGIVKKTLMSDYKKIDKLCKVKAEDEILHAFCCDDVDNILMLLDNGKIQNLKVADVKTSGKLTIGSKGATAGVVQAACIKNGGLFYTIDNENRCKRTRISDMGSTTVAVNEGCIKIGAVEKNMFWYDGSKIIPINWDSIAVKSRTSQGAKLGTKNLVQIG